MNPRGEYELPEEKQRVFRRAVRLEWWTIGFLISIAALMYLAMGQSQAMKAAWIEDVISLLPPIVFLLSAHLRRRKSSKRFPFGFPRVSLLAFLVASSAVLVLGLYILIDSVLALVSRHHPTIGMMELFGHRFWAGWLMLAVLVYSMIPPVILGNLKKKPGVELHEKTLFADAAMNAADWKTALAAIVGIALVGFGFWWGDAVAAGLISLDICKDGGHNAWRAVLLLLDQRPTSVKGAKPLGVDQEIIAALESFDWVARADARVREQGHLFSAIAFVRPAIPSVTPEQVADAARAAEQTDWRLDEVTVTLVPRLERGS